MTVTMLVGVFGGLGLFLLGMRMMAEGLQKAAGQRLRRILELFTTRPIYAVLTGSVVTVLLQSSATTTVMVVGFVNSGLMNLFQAISTIMGANIGTTITAQIVSFNIYSFALPVIGFGAILNFFSKRNMWRHLGMGLLGFGLLLLGLSTMSAAVNPLKDFEPFLNALITLGRRPLLGILAGTVFTVLVQSSSAITGLVIAFALQGLISLPAGLSIIVGANLGTCITVILASIGTSIAARRAAISHVLFNAFGVLLFIIFRLPFTSLILWSGGTVPRQIANAHTFFNIFNTLIVFPLLPLFVRMVTFLVPGEDEIEERRPRYLDDHVLGSPAAIISANREAVRMGEIALDMVDQSLEAFLFGKINLLESVEQKEEVLNELEKAVVAYLAKANQFPMAEEQARTLTNLMHVVSDMERIGDHAVNIGELAVERHEHRLELSPGAIEDLQNMWQVVERITREAIGALQEHNVSQARRLMAQDDLVDDLEKHYRINHIGRLNEGLCNPEMGVLFLDAVNALERVGDHANNIAEAVADVAFSR